MAVSAPRPEPGTQQALGKCLQKEVERDRRRREAGKEGRKKKERKKKEENTFIPTASQRIVQLHNLRHSFICTDSYKASDSLANTHES